MISFQSIFINKPEYGALELQIATIVSYLNNSPEANNVYRSSESPVPILRLQRMKGPAEDVFAPVLPLLIQGGYLVTLFPWHRNITKQRGQILDFELYT
jgi:hypothetical protein